MTFLLESNVKLLIFHLNLSMLHGAVKCCRLQSQFGLTIRSMTTTEVSTALRPFYFSVHPDLFGQYPSQRTTNENSLKQLSSIIETLHSRKPIKPCNLNFYFRDRTCKEGTFRLIKIFFNKRNIRDTVLTILKSCELPTEYVDKIPKPQEQPKRMFKLEKKMDFTNMDELDPIFGPILKERMQQEHENYTLKRWLQKNYTIAMEITKSHKALKDEVARLREGIAKQYGLIEVRWDCGWNETHFRGCLKSFLALAEQHPNVMSVLRGRVLVFAPFTGVSLDGHIMLNSGEVRHNWLDLIKNVKKYDASLERIPAFEKAVSQVLRDIKVGRRKFMPKILAGEYERNLQQVTTSLSDYRGRGDYPKQWPLSLSKYEIVVETEAGPLMVSPTGQFIVPAGCPGVLIVNFIDDNMHDASTKMNTYKRTKYVERSLHKQCIEILQLNNLHKDDNVTPDIMIQCLEKLLQNSTHLEQLKGVNLNITNYYSVLSDGVVCVPWNWNL